MSDSEIESRTQAVGRKRNAAGEFKDLASYTSSRRSSKASKESGEISSSEDEADEIQEQNVTAHGTEEDPHAISEDGEIDEGASGDDEDSSDSSSSTSSSSDSDSDASSDADPLHNIAQSHPNDGQVRLHDLSPEDRHQQLKYFFYSSLQGPSTIELVYCLACGNRGHMASTCPSRTCPHCGHLDTHSASGCPVNRKCPRCRQRGHNARTCPNQTFHGADECDICSATDHIEEECPKMWSISTKPLPVLKQIPVRELRRYCYSCGSAEHWGDDCRYVRKEDLNAIKTWSAAHASKFVKYDAISIESENEEERPRKRVMGRPMPQGRGGPLNYDDDSEIEVIEAPPKRALNYDDDEVEEIEAPKARPWQMSLFDDGRD